MGYEGARHRARRVQCRAASLADRGRVAAARRASLRAFGRVALALRQALLPSEVCGTVVELCRRGEVVEVALNAEQQEDGGFFFEALWVLVG